MSDYRKNPHWIKKVEAIKGVKHTPSCTTCKSHDSVCSCNFKAPVRKSTPLNSDCILVNSLVCYKKVQKTAEFAFPFAVGPLPLTSAPTLVAILGALGITVTALQITSGLLSVRVRPDFTNIEQEITVLKDKIINLGFVPAFLDVRLAGVLLISLPIRIFFQEHTDCPGVCPGDTVTETDLVAEAILDQELIQIENGSIVVNLLLFKAILRTTITATRQVFVDPKNPDCHLDVNENRCDPTGTPATINFPRS